MLSNNLGKFFISIILPSISAIVLYIFSFFLLIIPQVENNMMERKKEMILELTNSAWSIIEEYNREYQAGMLSLDEAKQKTALQIEKMRYGKERKDYFWIIDNRPFMIMHPYRLDLIGTNLQNFTDSHNKKLFDDAVKIVENKGEGFIDYYWQWKDDDTRIVPKLSYVKGFRQWNWIVGTGIYLDDVQQEIKTINKKLFLISASIILIISIILIYLIRQSLKIENKRRNAEQKLLLSKEKYKTLVNASTEGTLMLADEKIIFANLKFLKIFGIDRLSIKNLHFNEIFAFKWEEILQLFTTPDKSITLETRLLSAEKANHEIVISVSKINYIEQESFIIIVKDISLKNKIEKANKALSLELQSSLLLMNQSIRTLIKEPLFANLNEGINEVAKKMSQKKQKAILIRQDNKIIGIVNDADLRNRVLAAQKNSANAVSEIMTAPVVAIPDNALLYEAVLMFWQNKISHLAVKNNFGEIIGILYNHDTFESQRNSLSYFVKEVEICENVQELKKIHQRIPILVKALIDSGDKALNIIRITSAVTDAVTKRCIELAIEQCGEPTAEFAFISMGSEGREEETLYTNQDNAIIFANDNNEERNREYFLKLAEKVNGYLHEIGYNLCKGEIMAKNPKWNHPLDVWKKYFEQWTNSPDPQNVLDSCIFFDFRCIYGNCSYAAELNQFIIEKTRNNGLFFHHFAESTTRFKTKLDSEIIDLKKLIIPLVGYARVMALKYEIIEKNTMKRLLMLKNKEVITHETFLNIEQIYNFLFYLRFRQQAQAIFNNEKADNQLNYNTLSQIEKNTLKRVFSEIQEIKTTLSFDFNIS